MASFRSQAMALKHFSEKNIFITKVTGVHNVRNEMKLEREVVIEENVSKIQFIDNGCFVATFSLSIRKKKFFDQT